MGTATIEVVVLSGSVQPESHDKHVTRVTRKEAASSLAGVHCPPCSTPKEGCRIDVMDNTSLQKTDVCLPLLLLVA